MAGVDTSEYADLKLSVGKQWQRLDLLQSLGQEHTTQIAVLHERTHSQAVKLDALNESMTHLTRQVGEIRRAQADMSQEMVRGQAETVRTMTEALTAHERRENRWNWKILLTSLTLLCVYLAHLLGLLPAVVATGLLG